MKNLRNERGMALMMAIVLTLISMVVILAVLYLITQGTQLSASSRRYKSALEASYGGVEVVTKEIMPQLLDGITQTQLGGITRTNSTSGLMNVLMGINPVFTSYTSCMKTKLTLSPSGWGGMCGANPTTVANLPQSYDVTFKLKGPPLQPNFNVYAKIVDTQPGNSDMSGIASLDAGAGVAYGAAGVSPMHIPATYRIEVQGERETNPLEKARLSVLYAY